MILYIFIILFYATLYDIAYCADPNRFISPRPLNVLYFSDFVYYSAVTITTLGYGDIIPAARFTKLLSASEVLVCFFVFLVYLLYVFSPAKDGEEKEKKEPIERKDLDAIRESISGIWDKLEELNKKIDPPKKKNKLTGFVKRFFK
ncbi:MAG: two pore domain potassium channel family protein [bacterium]|nr:two pore domain potassium channel family protein [bacterium]